MASQNAKSTADQDGPVNLTEIAAGMSWRDACKTLSVDYRCHSSGLVIQPLDDSENGIENDGGFSTIYVVISGYSVLHCGEKEIECTDGDVLFVPRSEKVTPPMSDTQSLPMETRRRSFWLRWPVLRSRRRRTRCRLPSA